MAGSLLGAAGIARRPGTFLQHNAMLLRRSTRLFLAALAAGLLVPAASGAERGSELTYLRIEAGLGHGVLAVDPAGGPERLLVPTGRPIRDYAWSPDRSRIAYVSGIGELWVVAATDASDARRLAAGLTDWYGSGPVWSPDGRRIAFVRKSWDLVLVDVATGAQRRLRDGGARSLEPRWSPDGRELAHTRTQPRVDPYGFSPRIAVTNVATGAVRFLAAGSQPRWSPDGTRLAFRSRSRARLAVVPRRGGRARPLSVHGISSGISWSPDGGRLAFAVSHSGGAYSIRTVGADGSGERVVSVSPQTQHLPAWSPDGSTIAFVSWRDFPVLRGPAIYVVGAGGGEARRLTGEMAGAPAWR
jgi:Tol biopolymer transport system component